MSGIYLIGNINLKTRYRKNASDSVKARQKLRGCGCGAYFRLNLQQRGPCKGLYKISSTNIEHNHTITKEAYIFQHRNRKTLNGETPKQAESRLISANHAISSNQSEVVVNNDTQPKLNANADSMSELAKYGAFMQIGHNIATCMQFMSDEKFEEHLAKLVKFKDCIQNNIDFELVVTEAQVEYNEEMLLDENSHN